MHSRPTHLQTTNTRSNAYWLQHDVQHYRMKYIVKKTVEFTSERVFKEICILNGQ